MKRRLLLLGLASVVMSAAVLAASEDVRLIEVAGEGAKYWPRWRGPSGQGYVPAGQYVDTIIVTMTY